VLDAVLKHFPELYHFVSCSFSRKGLLYFGDSVMESSEGVQQGDPLGPLLFCLALHDVLQAIDCDFGAAYLDDVTIAGKSEQIIQQLQDFEDAAVKVGLQLNYGKCEVICLSVHAKQLWQSSHFRFSEVDQTAASLFGSVLDDKGVDAALQKHIDFLEFVKPRLMMLSAHEALFLLKTCLGSPRIQYLLRTAPCFLS